MRRANVCTFAADSGVQRALVDAGVPMGQQAWVLAAIEAVSGLVRASAAGAGHGGGGAAAVAPIGEDADSDRFGDKEAVCMAECMAKAADASRGGRSNACDTAQGRAARILATKVQLQLQQSRQGRARKPIVKTAER